MMTACSISCPSRTASKSSCMRSVPRFQWRVKMSSRGAANDTSGRTDDQSTLSFQPNVSNDSLSAQSQMLSGVFSRPSARRSNLRMQPPRTGVCLIPIKLLVNFSLNSRSMGISISATCWQQDCISGYSVPRAYLLMTSRA